jgi:hypothetical protein
MRKHETKLRSTQQEKEQETNWLQNQVIKFSKSQKNSELWENHDNSLVRLIEKEWKGVGNSSLNTGARRQASDLQKGKGAQKNKRRKAAMAHEVKCRHLLAMWELGTVSDSPLPT